MYCAITADEPRWARARVAETLCRARPASPDLRLPREAFIDSRRPESGCLFSFVVSSLRSVVRWMPYDSKRTMIVVQCLNDTMSLQATEQIAHPSRTELELGAVLHALSDPVRLMIVAELARGEREYTCGSFALPVTKSTCTHHFKVLREAGVIQQRQQGTTAPVTRCGARTSRRASPACSRRSCRPPANRSDRAGRRAGVAAWSPRAWWPSAGDRRATPVPSWPRSGQTTRASRRCARSRWRPARRWRVRPPPSSRRSAGRRSRVEAIDEREKRHRSRHGRVRGRAGGLGGPGGALDPPRPDLQRRARHRAGAPAAAGRRARAARLAAAGAGAGARAREHVAHAVRRAHARDPRRADDVRDQAGRLRLRGRPQRARLERAFAQAAVGAISGAVGTYSATSPEFEAARAGAGSGLEREPVSTQVVARDRHAELLQAIALAGAGLERFATELRHLARTEVGEVREPFGGGQKGSSSMPHKRNPIKSEQVVGLARVLRGNAQAGLEDVALWHERDISHSSVERIILPDSTILLDHLQRRVLALVEGMVVDAERMRENLELTYGALFSQRRAAGLGGDWVGRGTTPIGSSSAWRSGRSTKRMPLRELLARRSGRRRASISRRSSTTTRSSATPTRSSGGWTRSLGRRLDRRAAWARSTGRRARSTGRRARSNRRSGSRRAVGTRR